MPKKRKHFIDKKNAVTFSLVHRSQKDPLQADEDAPQRVLLPVEEKAERREEQAKYGIYFDDEYNYLQHLKATDDDPGQAEIVRIPARPSKKVASLKLPEEVFPSEQEQDIGMLNLAARVTGPQEGVDPDVIAALDEDFDFEDPDNRLEDDFVIKANDEPQGLFEEIMQSASGSHLMDYLTSQRQFLHSTKYADETAADLLPDISGTDYYREAANSEDEDSGEDDEGSDHGSFEYDADTHRTESKFTEYSLTSSVVPRSENLKLVDDWFEQFYDRYLEDEVGALEPDETAGYLDPNSDRILQLAMEHDEKKKAEKNMNYTEEDRAEVVIESDSSTEEDDDDDEYETVALEKPAEKWDCESILSTYSNLYNHPHLIVEHKKPRRKSNSKHEETTKDEGDDDREEADEEADDGSVAGVVFMRKKGESAEEKKQRKQAIKEKQRQRREEKKNTKLVFKEEEKRLKDVRKTTQMLHTVKIS